MYLPKKHLIEMQMINKICYGVIVPRVFLKLNQSINIYLLDSKIISEKRIKTKLY